MDRTAKLIAAGIAAFVVVTIAVAAYPSVFFGVSRGDVEASFNDELPDRQVSEYGLSCRRLPSDNWQCGPYELDVDWRGCWTVAPRLVTDDPLAGCIGIADKLGFHGPPYE